MVGCLQPWTKNTPINLDGGLMVLELQTIRNTLSSPILLLSSFLRTISSLLRRLSPHPSKAGDMTMEA